MNRLANPVKRVAPGLVPKRVTVQSRTLLSVPKMVMKLFELNIFTPGYEYYRRVNYYHKKYFKFRAHWCEELSVLPQSFSQSC